LKQKIAISSFKCLTVESIALDSRLMDHSTLLDVAKTKSTHLWDIEQESNFAYLLSLSISIISGETWN